jgi:predicted TIM-barrel fold metal-dependent hydrolase
MRVSKAIKAGVVDETEFQQYWDLILDDFSRYIQSKEPAQKGEMVAAVDEKALNAIKLIEEERSVAGALKVRSMKSGPSDDQGFYPTDGFCYHFDNLMDLVKKRSGELFPYIAIDPRRPGMIKALLSGEFFKSDSRFYGVKLYPRMGFHPQCKPMDDVYKFCSDNNLTIIFHCGLAGFPPSTTWKYSDFGNPVHFEPVVKKYPNLKIDFAHLGSSDDTHEWAKKIIQLINENENVYSDLSCYTDIDDLKRVKTYLDDNLKLRERLMFGTDFDVMYFTGRITMQKYYDNFKSVFSADELKILMTENPVRFFG